MFEVTLGLLGALVTGVVSGLYSGAVIARYSRFSNLRAEALRIVRSIDYMQEPAGMVIGNTERVSELPLIASDLAFLGHKAAAMQLFDTSNSLAVLTQSASYRLMSVEMVAEILNSAQATIRSLRGSTKVIFLRTPL